MTAAPRSVAGGRATRSTPGQEAGDLLGRGRANPRPDPKGVALTTDDIREGLVGVLSVFVPDSQFQRQTKDRLNNPELTSMADGLVRPTLEHWLNHNISVAE